MSVIHKDVRGNSKKIVLTLENPGLDNFAHKLQHIVTHKPQEGALYDRTPTGTLAGARRDMATRPR